MLSFHSYGVMDAGLSHDLFKEQILINSDNSTKYEPVRDRMTKGQIDGYQN